MSAPSFDRDDDERIAAEASLRPDLVFEVIRREGEEELRRPLRSLIWAGIAAGLAISVSCIAEAMLARRLPDAPWAELIADMGYSLGFILVILGRLQ
ncbi:MAG: formate/nitrite transporter family protein, partial [Pseudomonadota bacterium]